MHCDESLGVCLSTEPNLQVWRVDTEFTQDEAILHAASVVRNSGVIIYPTETFYGLGGHPGRPAAIERIFRIKARDFKKPLPLIASDVGSARKVVAVWPSDAEKLAQAFWPGPLTLILAAKDFSFAATEVSRDMLLSPIVHAHTGKIAIRVSSHPIARALASRVGGLLISTSTNFSGDPPVAAPDRIPAALLNQVDGLLHGGKLVGQLPSTIVDVSSLRPRLVRTGCLSWDKIQAVLMA